MMASMDFLAPLVDLQLNNNNNNNNNNSNTSTKPIRTFSRLAKGTPLNNNSLFLTTQPTISSSPLSAPPTTTTAATATQYTPSKVMRFHRSTPSTPVDNSGDDFLHPGCDQKTQPDKEKQPSKMFTAHRHLDRQDIDLLSPLQPHLDKLPPLPAPSLSLSTTPSTPLTPLTPLTPTPSTPFRPTFTRITKPAFHVNTLDNNSTSVNSGTDKKETETCTSTSAKSCRGYGGFHRASNPGTPSSTPSLGLGRNNTLAPSLLLLPGHGNNFEHGQGHGHGHGHEHGRSSSTSSSSSLSSTTLTPPELSPSTTSWSESSSPPQFLLPSLDYDWWRKDGSSSSTTTPTLSSCSSKSTPLSDGPNSSVLPSPHFYSLSSARKGAMEGHELGSERDTYFTPGPGPLLQTFRRTTEATAPQSDYIGLLLSGSDEEDEASEHSTDPDDGILSSSSCSSSPPRHGYQIKPKTAFHRPRFPAPPPALTGFSAITPKSITSATSTSEPSPQDFLGEADLPYPLPSTLQERQARQRKRAEQLKQLQIREEREACLSENRRRMRRRGASFSAGMSLTTPPAAPTASRPASMSFVTPLCINRSSPSLLKRSPSSPAKKSGLGSGRPKNCVGFDLRRTKVFEYDASEEVDKSSSPQSSGDEGVEEEEVEDDDDEEEEDDEEGHEGDYYGFTPSSILSPDRKSISNIAEEDESLIS